MDFKEILNSSSEDLKEAINWNDRLRDLLSEIQAKTYYILVCLENRWKKELKLFF